MKTIPIIPRPFYMRDPHSEPLAYSQQLHNCADNPDITDYQKAQLVSMAYKFEHTNKKAAAVRKAVRSNISTFESLRGFRR